MADFVEKLLKKMKKAVTSLLVSSLILTSVASAAEIRKPFCVSDNVTAKCVYVGNFSPDFNKFWGNCNLPQAPGADESRPETGAPETDTNVPETDTNVPETDIPETNIPEGVSQFASQVLELVNRERAAAGLKVGMLLPEQRLRL